MLREKLHRLSIYMLNFWPPFLGAGIRIVSLNEDVTKVVVETKFRWWNKNVVDVQFGGTIYAMCDPFFMLILMENLGADYIVWDKAAQVKFLRPGKTALRATFEISRERIAEIKTLADSAGKTEPRFKISVYDTEGTRVAHVDKLLYVRRKTPASK